MSFIPFLLGYRSWAWQWRACLGQINYLPVSALSHSQGSNDGEKRKSTRDPCFLERGDLWWIQWHHEKHRDRDGSKSMRRRSWHEYGGRHSGTGEVRGLVKTAGNAPEEVVWMAIYDRSLGSLASQGWPEQFNLSS